MTLQQRFNRWGWLHGAIGIGVLVAFVAWMASHGAPSDPAEKQVVLGSISDVGTKVSIFLVGWFVFLPIVARYTFERCPSCKTHYSYREPDLDGTKNRSFRADNHCHKCGFSFTGSNPK